MEMQRSGGVPREAHNLETPEADAGRCNDGGRELRPTLTAMSLLPALALLQVGQPMSLKCCDG